MTYNEWRDELKTNLLSFSESERRRVLDYYAEAYADRRDAGYSEREIIQEFGAPYDAARRILDEGDYFSDSGNDYSERDYRREDKYDRRREERLRRDEERRRRDEERRREDELRREEQLRRDEERRREEQLRRDEERRREDERKRDEQLRRDGHLYKSKERGDYGWVFVLLCIIFCVPLAGLITGMVGVTIGLFVAPFALLISGVATAGMGVGELVGGGISGLCTLGTGLIVFGVSIILMPITGKIIKLMWNAFKWIMGRIKGLFSNKERV